MENEEVAQVVRLLTFIKTSSKVLSGRIAMLLALILTFALFAWCMIQPDVWRFATATTFALLIFVPTVILDIRAAAKGE